MMEERDLQAMSNVYSGLIGKIFSGQCPPGTQLVERDLAKEFGVSRIPIRESLARLVAQGVLISGKKGTGVWVREYSSEEVQHLYLFREAIEIGIVRSVSEQGCSPGYLSKLRHICKMSEPEVGRHGSPRWADMDHKFHETLADASGNDRMISSLKALLAECHYVFYLHPANNIRKPLPPKKAHVIMQDVLDEHLKLITHIKKRDVSGAEETLRHHLRKNSSETIDTFVSSELKFESMNQPQVESGGKEE